MRPPKIDLSRAVVAVTGGARGIGRACAELFAERGAAVAVGDLDGEAAAIAALVGLSAAVRTELAGTGVTITTVLPSVVNTDLASGIPIPLARLARVEPEDVARAIVASCDGRPKEVAVPRWVALYPIARPFIPDRIESLVRRLLGDDRALSAVDPAGRAAYIERLARQTSGRD